MNKKELFTFRGVNQDVTKSKHPKEFYYEGNNIRISATDSQSTGSISNEKGTLAVLSLPTPSVNVVNGIINYGDKKLTFLNSEIKDQFTGKVSGEQKVIGHTIARDNIIVFSTDDTGFDCVWEITEVDNVFDITLLYMRNLGFSINSPIQSIFNFENDRIQKVYWVDGNAQLRFLNIRHSKENEYLDNLIDINSNTINIVGNFKVSQPVITDIVSGGNHTAGMIQYAYNLYRLNSSQTKLSPLSSLIPLDKGVGQGGGDVNEVVGSTPIVEMKQLDPEYTHIKVYAIKYNAYNQQPVISLIKDQEINTNRTLTVFDDGNVINDIALSEFLFLGTDPIIPKHIEAKDNILFSANIKEKNFDVKLDTRAYSFTAGLNATSKVYTDLKLKEVTETSNVPSVIQGPIKPRDRGDRTLGFDDGMGNTYDPDTLEYAEPPTTQYTTTTNTRTIVSGEGWPVNKTTWNVPTKHDAVNVDYDKYKYQKDGSTYGGEGKYIKYEIVGNDTVDKPESRKFFKDSEVYRLGIHFYNRLGQKSLPKWIADFRAPEGNLEGKYNTLKLTLKPEFYVWLNTSSNFDSEDEKPVGFRVLRANRTVNDKTIVSQGFLNSMMSNYRTSEKSDEFSAQARNRAKEGNKLPSLQRTFARNHTQMLGMKHNLKLDTFDGNDDMREVHKASSSQNWIAETFQYNILMQMFSPEVLFGNVALYEGLELKVKGALKNKVTQFWGQIREVDTKEVLLEGKVLNGLTPHDDIINNNTQELNINGHVNNMADYAIFGTANKRDEHTEMDFYQFNRDFNGDYVKGVGKRYPVYGKPDLTERGQGGINYNGDPAFKFYNSLQPMIADGGDGRGENSPAITSVNSWGAKCITMVLGPDDRDYKYYDRPKLETLWKESGVTDTNVMLVAELVKNNEQIYLGGIYGGNSYEDKKRTPYIEIGKYMDINTTTAYILSPGDTFVQTFKFAKLGKTDTEVYSSASLQLSEIVEGRIETTIDLRNRNDISRSGWDSRFQPRDEEFHKYNRVYSQEPTLLQEQDVDYNFRKVKNFDTRIMASKIKVPGENIDNWTDMLINEVQDLNGKYGPINSLVSFRDNIFALQDKAFAAISINPRVQVQGSDGIAVELGSGSILHDYQYISTNSGTLNKWAVCATQHAIYYLDTVNKCFNRYSQGIEKLSDMYGLHTWFQNNVDYETIKNDNPYLNKGAHVGYDLVNNSILLTFNQENPYTRLFSESSNTFIGLMDYKPSCYIVSNSRLFSLDNSNNGIHEHFKGEYNKFYGQYYPSYVTLMVNPNVHGECVFDNIEYNAEMYLNDVDVFNKSFTHIQAWNEYQDSGKVPLVLGRGTNLSRKMRTWRAQIPRQGRNRMRNPWIYLRLNLNNEDDYKMILHDIVVDYTIN